MTWTLGWHGLSISVQMNFLTGTQLVNLITYQTVPFQRVPYQSVPFIWSPKFSVSPLFFSDSFRLPRISFGTPWGPNDILGRVQKNGLGGRGNLWRRKKIHQVAELGPACFPYILRWLTTLFYQLEVCFSKIFPKS